MPGRPQDRCVVCGLPHRTGSPAVIRSTVALDVVTTGRDLADLRRGFTDQGRTVRAGRHDRELLVRVEPGEPVCITHQALAAGASFAQGDLFRRAEEVSLLASGAMAPCAACGKPRYRASLVAMPAGWEIPLGRVAWRRDSVRHPGFRLDGDLVAVPEGALVCQDHTCYEAGCTDADRWQRVTAVGKPVDGEERRT
jgi:hypothetical protein